MSRKSSQAPSISVIFAEPESSVLPPGSAAAKLTPVASTSTPTSSASSVKGVEVGRKRSGTKSRANSVVEYVQESDGASLGSGGDAIPTEHANILPREQEQQDRHGGDGNPTNTAPRLPPSLRSKDVGREERRGSWFSFKKRSNASLVSHEEQREPIVLAEQVQTRTEEPPTAPLVTIEPTDDIKPSEAEISRVTPTLYAEADKLVVSAATISTPSVHTSNVLPAISSRTECDHVGMDLHEESVQTSGIMPDTSPQCIRIIANEDVPKGEKAGSETAEQDEPTNLPHRLPPAKCSKHAERRERSGSWFSFVRKAPAAKVHVPTFPVHEAVSPAQEQPEQEHPETTPEDSAEPAVETSVTASVDAPTPTTVTTLSAIDIPTQPRSSENCSAALSPRSRAWFGSISKGKEQRQILRETDGRPVAASSQVRDDVHSNAEALQPMPPDPTIEQSGTSVWLSPQPPPRPTLFEHASSLPSSIDDEIPYRPESAPIVIPPPELVSTQTTDVKLATLNPTASRFALSMPLLGRPKVPIQKVTPEMNGKEIPPEPAKMQSQPAPRSGECNMSRRSNYFKHAVDFLRLRTRPRCPR